MDEKYWLGLLVIASLLVGGVTYYVVDTGNELTCGTNKPYGWNIIQEHETYFEAVCPYKTKEPLYTNCGSFRATASYERYGCNEVMVIEIDEPISKETEKLDECWGDCYKCNPNGCEV